MQLDGQVDAIPHIGQITRSELRKEIRSISDKQLISHALNQAFAEQVILKEPYRHMTAREFRRALREA